MKKIYYLMFLMMIPAVFAGTVSRTFSTQTPCMGEEFDVTLNVDVNTESSYLIDEVVPAGFTVTNSGGGDSTTNPPHIFWTILSGAEDTTHTYTVQAPMSTGTSSFSGTYGFSGGSETDVGGLTDVTVADCQPTGDVEERLAALEDWKTTAEQDLSLLMQWKTTVDNTIQAIKDWLGFSSHSNLCDAAGSCSGVACESDSDCLSDTYLGEFCQNNDVYNTQRDYYCSNPGTLQSSCEYTDTDELVEDCAEACLDGECVAVSCNSDSDCPSDRYLGRYCDGAEVHDTYRDYSCENAGTPSAACEYTDTDETIMTCNDACVDGECQSFTCTQDSDCGTDEWVTENYCDGNAVYRDQRTYTCSNPGTLDSSCSDSVDPVLVETCAGDCVDGQCDTSQSVIFRTNGQSANYPLYSGTWLAMDVDGNGELEGYQKKYSTSISFCPSCRLTDPYGNCVIVWNGDPCVVTSRMGYSCSCSRFTDYWGAETSSSPTEPYASNGQEVYG